MRATSAGLADANSTEFDPQTPHRVIYKLRELLGVDEMGGTMRLGAGRAESSRVRLPNAPTARWKSASATGTAMNSTATTKQRLVAAGLRITGRTPDGTYVEIVEAPDHPWFLGCQFHPEFKSKPLAPHPLFAAFVGAAARPSQREAGPQRQQCRARE